MPTRLEADVYVLGVRLKQALLLTRSDGRISDARFVQAIVLRLAATIAKLKTASSLPATILDALDRLASGCRWMLDGLSSGSEDDYLENLYDEFHRRAQLAVDTLALPDGTMPGRAWFNLGLEIADGRNEFRKVRDGGKVVSFEVTDRWRRENPEAVSRLAKQVRQKLGDLMPTEPADDTPWMYDVPDSWIGWARLERGVSWLESIAEDVPAEPAVSVGSPDAPSAERVNLPPPPSEPTVQGRTTTGSPGPTTLDLKSLPPTQQKIYQVLDAANSRLTTGQVLSAFAEQFGKESEGSVKPHLAEMRRRGILDNRDDVKPRGYGILMRP